MDNFKRIMDGEFKIAVIGDGIIKASTYLPLLAVLFLFSALFSYQTNFTTSMYPTIEEGTGLLVARHTDEIERGDIIAFDGPNFRTDYAKRVLGLPGETIVIKNHMVYIDGIYYDDPYKRNGESSYDIEVTLESDEYFVVGDNRYVSKDSRDYGPIKKDLINGKVIYIFNIAKSLGYGSSIEEISPEDMDKIPAEFR